jgi:hypothetical protein
VDIAALYYYDSVALMTRQPVIRPDLQRYGSGRWLSRGLIVPEDQPYITFQIQLQSLSNSAKNALPDSLPSGLVLVDQLADELSPTDPARRRREGQYVGGAQAGPVSLVAASGAAVLDVLRHDHA